MPKKNVGVRRVVENQADLGDRRRAAQETFDRGGDYGSGLFTGIAIGSRGDSGECDGAELVFRGDSERVAITGSEKGAVRFAAATDDRSDGVDDVSCRKRSGGSQDGLTGRQTLRKARRTELTTLIEDARSAAAMDCVIHTAATEKSAVGGVNNGVYL